MDIRTFDTLWDESYDLEPNDQKRIQKIADLVQQLDQLTRSEKQDLYQQAIPILNHNYNHFYSGAFQEILWQELTQMLSQIDAPRPPELDQNPPC